MEAFIDILRTQYAATIIMLERIIDCCPDNVWEEKFNGIEFWREVNHCLYWLELLTIKWRPFDQNEYCIGKNQIKEEFEDEYVDRIGIKEYMRTIAGINSAYLTGTAKELADDHEGDLEKGLTRLIETLRHGQHHIGKLAGYLQSKGIEVVFWE